LKRGVRDEGRVAERLKGKNDGLKEGRKDGRFEERKGRRKGIGGPERFANAWTYSTITATFSNDNGCTITDYLFITDL
jgi:hypothetical protein